MVANMDTTAMLSQARKMAMKAKPGMLKANGKTYTFEFDQARWVYNVYEDLFLLVTFNCKSLSVAKKWLREYLAN